MEKPAALTRRRPKVSPEVRALIRISLSNPRWGAPRLHGELLKLGIEICETSVAHYMARRRKPPSQTCRPFLESHLRQLVAVDFFIVPTLTFRVLFVFIVLSHERFNVTEHSTAEWTAQQIREAFPWETAPRLLLRDRDKIYGKEEIRTAPQSPWENPYAEQLVRSIRKECLEHLIVFNERSLRRIPRSYVDYHQRWRSHLALGKDTPIGRQVQPPALGQVIEIPEVGGLPHRYIRRAA